VKAHSTRPMAKSFVDCGRIINWFNCIDQMDSFYFLIWIRNIIIIALYDSFVWKYNNYTDIVGCQLHRLVENLFDEFLGKFFSVYFAEVLFCGFVNSVYVEFCETFEYSIA
jgi:hypothetical protein